MKIGLIVAMQSEFNLVKSVLKNQSAKHLNHLFFIEGTINNKHVVLMQGGIGKVNASCACVEMIKSFMPDLIINTGLAGGIDKIVKVMDVVAGNRTTYHDVWCGEGCKLGQIQGLPAEFEGDANLINIAKSLQDKVNVICGQIVSGDKFITDAQSLSEIKSNFPDALAVDMESAAISQVCHLYNVPFLALRIISDTPGIENHNQQYLDFWNKAPEKSLQIIEQIISKITD